MTDADGPLQGLLASTHLAVPDDLPGLIEQHAAALGATGATLYLADLEQRWLVPVVSPKADIELVPEASTRPSAGAASVPWRSWRAPTRAVASRSGCPWSTAPSVSACCSTGSAVPTTTWDQQHAAVAILDGLGHGLDAGLLATAAVAAYRNSRRQGLDLAGAADRVGRTIDEHFEPTRFVTGILATLDLQSGRFAWTTAGHPAPLLIRHHRVVKHLDPDNGLPFGVGPASEVFEEHR